MANLYVDASYSHLNDLSSFGVVGVGSHDNFYDCSLCPSNYMKNVGAEFQAIFLGVKSYLEFHDDNVIIVHTDLNVAYKNKLVEMQNELKKLFNKNIAIKEVHSKGIKKMKNIHAKRHFIADKLARLAMKDIDTEQAKHEFNSIVGMKH